jgi:hypothetical protein
VASKNKRLSSPANTESELSSLEDALKNYENIPWDLSGKIVEGFVVLQIIKEKRKILHTD